MRRRSIQIAVCLLLAAGAAHAAPLTSEISLDSDRSETHLDIRGPARIAGTTPLQIGALPAGEYLLTADGPGLPRARGRFLRTQSGIIARAWAEPAALLFPPGLVHMGRGEKRGWLFLDTGIASGAMAAISVGRLDDAKNDRSKAAAAYASAVSEREIQDTRLALEAAERKVDDEAEIRNLWVGALAYTWVAAGVEALLLTPQPKFTSTSDGQVRLALPEADGLEAGIRSALIPGSGQRFMGRNGKAALFTGATAALGIAAIVVHDDFLEARRDQEDAQSRFLQAETDTEVRDARKSLQDAADETDEKNIIQWSVIGTLAGVYLWNVLDAFDTGHRAGTSGLSIATMMGTDGDLKIGASWSFQ